MAIDPVERDRLDNENMKRLMAFTLATDANCIDIGAHEGTILREIVRCAPGGHHIAYEPLPRYYDGLVREFPRVDVRCAALSNEKGKCAFKDVKTHPGYSGFRERTYPGVEEIDTITVRTERLDESLPPGYLPAFIKIDVEGAERLVFEGAIETIKRAKPIIVFEHGLGAANHYQTRPEQIFDLLCDQAGLRIFDLDGDGPYGQGDFVLTFDRGLRWNFIAHR